jgi:hypothetical protein
MRELRAAVNAVFFFVLFLFVWGLVRPGHAVSSLHGPRFLRMQVEDSRSRHDGPDRFSLSVPFGLVRGGLKFASLGRLRREMDLHFSDSVEADEVRGIWKELSEKPDGTPVERKRDFDALTFTKEGDTVTLVVKKDLSDPDPETVTIRFPARLLAAVASGGKSLDVDAILSELGALDRGELLDVKAKDAHVRVWIE